MEEPSAPGGASDWGGGAIARLAPTVNWCRDDRSPTRRGPSEVEWLAERRTRVLVKRYSVRDPERGGERAHQEGVSTEDLIQRWLRERVAAA